MSTSSDNILAASNNYEYDTQDYEQPVAKKQKVSIPVENILSTVCCTFKDPIHIVKDPIRLPCSNRYICKECTWMINPDDKSFQCRFCKKRHNKGNIENKATAGKNKIQNLIMNNSKLIFDSFIRLIEIRIQELNGKLYSILFKILRSFAQILERWRNYKETVEIKEQYFDEELDITIESINIRYDMFREELCKEFYGRLELLKKYLSI